MLGDNLNEIDAEAVERMILLRIERVGDWVADENGQVHRSTILGFAVDLPEQTESARAVVAEFTESLGDTVPVSHILKFEDPLLHADLVRWGEEIYALELKLRRVLTLVYLNAYEEGDPYDLLREESVQPTSKERPNPEHMKKQGENQFFHLTFNQYVSLNQRPDIKLPALVELARNKEAYEQFRAELARAPVEDEDDTVLLAGLKERMDAIEAMRNCCAHNRSPSKKVHENYLNARPLLDQLLDGYLARWEYQEPVEEMFWGRRAREAVEKAMEEAHWDEEDKSIRLFDEDDDRIGTTVHSREELEEYLRSLADAAFCANAPTEDGEFLESCDEYGIVEAALTEYEQRLEEFFSPGSSRRPKIRLFLRECG